MASQCPRTLQMMLCGLFIGTQTFWQILVPKLVIADVFHSEGITLVRMLGWRINGLCSKPNRKLFWIFVWPLGRKLCTSKVKRLEEMGFLTPLQAEAGP